MAPESFTYVVECSNRMPERESKFVRRPYPFPSVFWSVDGNDSTDAPSVPEQTVRPLYSHFGDSMRCDPSRVSMVATCSGVSPTTWSPSSLVLSVTWSTNSTERMGTA